MHIAALLEYDVKYKFNRHFSKYDIKECCSKATFLTVCSHFSRLTAGTEAGGAAVLAPRDGFGY